MQYGKSIRYAGYAPSFDDILYEGEVDAGSFVAYFCLKDDVLSVASLNHDPWTADFANLLLEGRRLPKAEAVGGRWRK